MKIIISLALVLCAIYFFLYMLRKVMLKLSGGRNFASNTIVLSYIDQNNKIISFNYQGIRYIILIGKTSNILLDKYEENISNT